MRHVASVNEVRPQPPRRTLKAGPEARVDPKVIAETDSERNTTISASHSGCSLPRKVNSNAICSCFLSALVRSGPSGNIRPLCTELA